MVLDYRINLINFRYKLALLRIKCLYLKKLLIDYIFGKTV